MNLQIDHRPTRKERSRKRFARRRKGAALIEFAICLPFITLIVLSSMECTNYIFMRQALVQSAYEGARVAINPQSNESTATNRVKEVLDGRNIKNSSISFSPRLRNAERGDLIEVTVSAPSNGNLLFGLPGFSNRNVSVNATMVRE